MKLTTFVPKKELKKKIKKKKLNIKLENLTTFLKKYDGDSKKKKYAQEYLTLMKQELYKNSTSTPSLESLKLLRLKDCLIHGNDKEDFALIMARVKDFRIESIKERFYSNIFNSQRWWHMTIKMKMNAEGETPEMKHFFDCNQTLLTPGKMPIKTKTKTEGTKTKARFSTTDMRNGIGHKDKILKYYASMFENKATPDLNNEQAIKYGIVSKKWIDEKGDIKTPFGDSIRINGMPEGGIKLTYTGIPKGKLCTDFIQVNKNDTIFFNNKSYDGIDYVMVNKDKIKLDHYVYKQVQRVCNKQDKNTVSFVREKIIIKHQYTRKSLDSAFGLVKKIKSIDIHTYDPNSAAYTQGNSDFAVIGNEAKLYDSNLETLVQKLPSKLENSYNTALSSDGKYLAVGRYGSTIHIWDMKQSKMIKTIKKNIGGVRMFLSDNKTLVVADKQISLLDIESEKIVATIKPNYMPLKQKYNFTRISAIAESPDGKMLYIGGNKNVIERWKIEKNFFSSNRKVSYIDKIEDRTMGEIGSLSFDKKDDDILIIGSKNLKIKFCDTKKKKVQKIYIADEYMGCEDIVLSKDEKYMLAIGSHGAFLWKLGQQEQYDIVKGSKPVGGMFLEDSSKFILMSRDINIWQIQNK
jgi:WD40 repeat protein